MRRTGLLLRLEGLVIVVELLLRSLGLLVVDRVGTSCCACQLVWTAVDLTEPLCQEACLRKQ